MITSEQLLSTFVPTDAIVYRDYPFDPDFFIALHEQQSMFLHEWAAKIEERTSGLISLDQQIDFAQAILLQDAEIPSAFPIDRDVTRAVALGICVFRDIKRKSGLRYQTHVFKVAPIGPEFNESEDVQKRAILEANVHDIIEEGAIKPYRKGKPFLIPIGTASEYADEYEVIDTARRWLNDELPGQQLGDCAVLLTELKIPDEFIQSMTAKGYDPYVVEYGVFAEQIRMYADVGGIQAEIGDRLDDILNLSYIIDNQKLTADEKYHKLLDKFAKCLFTVNYISRNDDFTIIEGVSERLVLVYCNVLERIAVEQGISINDIVDKATEYDQCITTNRADIQAFVNEYLERVGVLQLHT